jgi:hypothetical protein
MTSESSSALIQLDRDSLDTIQGGALIDHYSEDQLAKMKLECPLTVKAIANDPMTPSEEMAPLGFVADRRDYYSAACKRELVSPAK